MHFCPKSAKSLSINSMQINGMHAKNVSCKLFLHVATDYIDNCKIESNSFAYVLQERLNLLATLTSLVLDNGENTNFELKQRCLSNIAWWICAMGWGG